MLTLSAIMAVAVSVTVPAAAHMAPSSRELPSIAYAASASDATQQVSSAAGAEAEASVPDQSFASSIDTEISAATRDALAVEKIVVEPPPAPVYAGPSGSFAGSYAGEFAGFLAMWPASAPVNDGFGYRGAGEFHGGIDLMTGSGATIVSASPGVVTQVTFGGGWGQFIKIDHGSGVSTLYSHLIQGSQMVSPGQTVAAGTPIGLSGSTGYVTVAHLHFETYVNGSRVDPMGLLP
ncbi:murein DD-endopeptidase MepM/ murein hydrolase activator NlpD [Rhodoglobus vestalii]|uniref:Murein DD-endopeptidase MepM/ murein hydrolase activator NlpD n=1 Tax=Rhodoglobus vestalii TaxID=193384 RepID=A0A8H2K542_9MICO|nr:M23 family metallopeptidase [Rhodoglobus vestalii]TQO19978.1 murein DD-endopeptidase MepM/ murein hydrolase activator NlpD [Rhodoglobus vestalii]